MQIPNILKVIYAPHKALKEIAEKPSYLGPILIVIIFVAANVGFAYLGISKTYIEQTSPNGQAQDEWTENSTLWTSNAYVSESSDNINGTYYGNRSIAFSITDSSQVQMQLKDIGPVNCSGPSGFSVVSFRLKQSSPQDGPQNATLYMFSTSPSDYFSYDLAQDFSNFTDNVWSNLTIPLGSGWLRGSPNADWNSITGLRLEFTWTGSSNVTMLVDGLFFHGVFKSLLETAGGAYLVNFALMGGMQFVITWVLLSGLLYLLSKTLGARLVWRLMLILVGSVLVTMVVQAIINIAAYSTLSKVSYSFDLLVGVNGEGQAVYDAILDQTWLVNQIARYTQIAVYVWTIALSALAVHLVGEQTWTKSFLAATVAYVATIFVGGFLFGL